MTMEHERGRPLEHGNRGGEIERRGLVAGSGDPPRTAPPPAQTERPTPAPSPQRGNPPQP